MSNIDHMGRPLKVGVDIHAPACTEFAHCVCGLATDEDQRIADRNNPFLPWRNIVPERGEQ